jgi:CubicO group peptidase (beta-lactamase class C family)
MARRSFFIRLALALFAAAVPALAAAQQGCSPSYLNAQQRFSHNEARAGNVPRMFGRGAPLDNVTYRVAGDAQPHSLLEYLARFCTTGFLVLHEDRIVFEQYLQGTKAEDALLSASMSKTILSLLVGVAIAEGKLTLDTTVAQVLPDFKASAFADDTVEDLLRMATGVQLHGAYEPGAVSDNRATDPMVSPRESMRRYLREKTERSSTGKTFNYNGAVTALLGLMLSERTGMSNTDYLEARIWSRIGAEGSGFWIKNAHGEEGVQGQFAARLRDYARLGSLVLNRGRAGGEQVVPAEWIAQMTTLRPDKPQPKGPPFYGLHVWIPQAAGGRSFFWGVGGQNIFVDPVARTVIVHMGNSRDARFAGDTHLFALRDAIARSLTARAMASPPLDSSSGAGHN